MPMNVTGAGNGQPRIEDHGAIPPDVRTPGFNEAGLPLGDADVWGLAIGRGASKRFVNTADMHTAQSIDGIESKKLLELAKNDPKAFMTRLLADSSNGTPVELKFTKLLKGFGVARIDFRAENGHMTTLATLEIFNKAADGFLKSYMAKEAREKGTRSSVSLEVKGDLNKDGGIDNISAEIRAANLPAFSAEKLMELEKVKGQIKDALAGEGSPAEKQDRVQEIVASALQKASEIPVAFFVELIRDRHNLNIKVNEEGHSLTAHAKTGEGNYAISFTDILDSENKAEADLGAKIAGNVGEDRDTIKIGEVAVFTTDKLSIAWGEENRPVVSKIGEDGTKSPVDDHLGEILMYLPALLALANRGNL
jgi:hypothetical protein